MDIRQIEDDVKKSLKPKRFRHTIGVKYTSICLAMRYGEDLDKAAAAGLLHDCAKNLSDEKLLSLCREKGIPVPEKGSTVKVVYDDAKPSKAKVIL